MLGHVSDKEGKKESKSKGNYTPPEIILDEVRMDFAVLDDKAAGVNGVAGEALIAREDLEGLDMQEGAKVQVFRPDQPGTALTLTVKAHKKLKRRVLLLAKKDLEALSVAPSAKGADVMPVEVPRLAPTERVVLKDPASKSPGADAFRWFFYAASPTWSNTAPLAQQRAPVAEGLPGQAAQRLLVLHHLREHRRVLARRRQRGSLRGPVARRSARAQGWREPKLRTVLDKWILSEVQLALRDTARHLDGYTTSMRRPSGWWRSWTRSPTGNCAAAATASGLPAWSRTSRTRTTRCTRRSRPSPPCPRPSSPSSPTRCWLDLVRRP